MPRLTASRMTIVRPGAMLRALASPVRVEVLEQLRASGPTSIADLARQLGRTPHSLYYHVHALERAGFLRRRATRRTARRDEAVYERIADAIALAYAPSSEAGTAAIERAGRAVLRRTERVFARAVLEGLVECPAGESDAFVTSRKAWLTPGGIGEVRRLLRRLDSVLARESRRRKGRTYLITTAMSPTIASRKT
jgi:DNA-binding MarR family transcriptional regulator